MATITARILQSFGLNINRSAIASRELGVTADTEQPVIGTTVGGAKYLGTEDYVTIATASPAAISMIRRSFVEYLCDTVGAGADIALDIRAGAETLGARLKVYALGATAYKVRVQYDTGVYANVPAGTATEFVWNGTVWGMTQAVTATTALNSISYDLVIDSDAKLAAWATSGTYAKVLIKAGTWTLASGGVDLTARGTKLVVGEPGSKLVFSSAQKGLYYTTPPTTNDYRMEGVTVETTSSGSGHSFYSCTNLTNCTGTGTGTSIGYGFYSCTNLTNCTGTGTGVGEGYGFYSCKKCQQNKKGVTSTTATYMTSYADAGTSYLCADTPNGGFNS